MNNQLSISIVIPCHNEERHIGALLRRVGETFKAVPHETIVVIDGCNDGSEAAVRAAAKNVTGVRLLVNERRLGKGGAIRRGILDAHGSTIGFIDGDNEIDPRFLLNAYHVLERGAYDIVIGNRYCKGAAYHTTMARHLTSRVYQAIIWMLFGLGIGDSQAGLKMFRSNVGKKLFNASNVNGYAFDIDVLMHAHWMGYRIAQIPMRQRFKGTSTIAHSHVLEMIADTCGTYSRHAREIMRRRETLLHASVMKKIRSTVFLPFTAALECCVRKILIRQK